MAGLRTLGAARGFVIDDYAPPLGAFLGIDPVSMGTNLITGLLGSFFTSEPAPWTTYPNANVVGTEKVDFYQGGHKLTVEEREMTLSPDSGKTWFRMMANGTYGAEEVYEKYWPVLIVPKGLYPSPDVFTPEKSLIAWAAQFPGSSTGWEILSAEDREKILAQEGGYLARQVWKYLRDVNDLRRIAPDINSKDFEGNTVQWSYKESGPFGEVRSVMLSPSLASKIQAGINSYWNDLKVLDPARSSSTALLKPAWNAEAQAYIDAHPGFSKSHVVDVLRELKFAIDGVKYWRGKTRPVTELQRTFLAGITVGAGQLLGGRQAIYFAIKSKLYAPEEFPILMEWAAINTVPPVPEGMMTTAQYRQYVVEEPLRAQAAAEKQVQDQVALIRTIMATMQQQTLPPAQTAQAALPITLASAPTEVYGSSPGLLASAAAAVAASMPTKVAQVPIAAADVMISAANPWEAPVMTVTYEDEVKPESQPVAHPEIVPVIQTQPVTAQVVQTAVPAVSSSSPASAAASAAPGSGSGSGPVATLTAAQAAAVAQKYQQAATMPQAVQSGSNTGLIAVGILSVLGVGYMMSQKKPGVVK